MKIWTLLKSACFFFRNIHTCNSYTLNLYSLTFFLKFDSHLINVLHIWPLSHQIPWRKKSNLLINQLCGWLFYSKLSNSSSFVNQMTQHFFNKWITETQGRTFTTFSTAACGHLSNSNPSSVLQKWFSPRPHALGGYHCHLSAVSIIWKMEKYKSQWPLKTLCNF